MSQVRRKSRRPAVAPARRTNRVVSPRRPRLLALGAVGLGLGGRALREAYAVEAAEVADIEALQSAPPSLLLLDGTWPARRRRALLAVLSGLDRTARPGLVVVLPQGRRLAPDLEPHADDLLMTPSTDRELLIHLRHVERLRESLADLVRKEREVAELAGRLQSMRRRMDEELRLAARLQRSLPPPPWKHPAFDLAHEFVPFREVGGDFYDFLGVGAERMGLVLGDVMGKGVPAALLASNLKASLRAQLAAPDEGPAAMVRRVNKLFWEVTPPGLFASLFFGVLDPACRRLSYVNAGHQPPFLVRRDGTIEDLVAGGPVLGLVEDAAYECGEQALHPGDTLVVYSDGVTERSGREDVLFGLDRLKAVAADNRRHPARIGLYSLLGEVQGWSAGRPADDDATLIVLRVR